MMLRSAAEGKWVMPEKPAAETKPVETKSEIPLAPLPEPAKKEDATGSTTTASSTSDPKPKN